jgi:hypothetical protein
MNTVARHWSAAALAVGAIFYFGAAAQAQFGQRLVPINPNPQIAPGVSLLQYSYNTAVLGRAYRQIPPYLLGYNPYPSPIYNPMVFQPSVYNPYSGYGPVAPASMPYGGGYSPYGAGAYGGGYSGGIDPLTGAGGYGGGYGGYPPYGYGGYEGAADLMAYAKLGISQEQARILREVANQAKLDTRKKTIDTLAYIRANEYTFTQEQADIAKRLLARVQNTPTAAEIQSGKSLNILLDDLVKFNNLNMRGPTVNLDEDVLKLINIAGAGSNGNIGLLRDNGRFTWPSVFDRKEIVSDKERRDLELEAKQIYDQAANGQPNANVLRNVESSLQTIRKNLTKQGFELTGKGYVEGTRFLDDFDAAVAAIKKGDVVLNLDFQQKFVKDGKRSVQELIEYMGGKGLRFAPASSGDDRGYMALQTALAAQSLAIHGTVAASGKGS